MGIRFLFPPPSCSPVNPSLDSWQRRWPVAWDIHAAAVQRWVLLPQMEGGKKHRVASWDREPTLSSRWGVCLHPQRRLFSAWFLHLPFACFSPCSYTTANIFPTSERSTREPLGFLFSTGCSFFTCCSSSDVSWTNFGIGLGWAMRV